MNINKFFTAKSIAVVGVSSDSRKVGRVIFHNLAEGAFTGRVYPVNPGLDKVANYRVYPSLAEIPGKVDAAVIAVPAKHVIQVLNDCGKKAVNYVVIISAGFKEIGNFELDKKLTAALQKHNIYAIGPNCLGIYDSYTGLDTLFLPRYRLHRPEKGAISFVCQSGAVGSAILDLASKEGYGFSKFFSYGNASNIDEADLLAYLDNDKNTKVICLYVESIQDGRKFLKIANSLTKPVVVIKGGITEAGSKAALSHTGSLAGAAEIYSGIFKQCNMVHAGSLEEMFDYAKTFEHAIKPRGNRVQVITNGGGFGILAADAIQKNGLTMAEPSKQTIAALKNKFPDIVAVKNPMDLVGDADTERYRNALAACMSDDNIDILLVIALYQTPLLDTNVVNAITEFNDLKKKPVFVVSCGGDFTEVLKESLEAEGVPCFSFPTNAVEAIAAVVRYYQKGIN